MANHLPLSNTSCVPWLQEMGIDSAAVNISPLVNLGYQAP
jgi:hypothetical protein